jgi:hypothetical protein
MTNDRTIDGPERMHPTSEIGKEHGSQTTEQEGPDRQQSDERAREWLTETAEIVRVVGP